MLRSVIKVNPEFVKLIPRFLEQPLLPDLKSKLLALKSTPTNMQIQVSEEEIEQLIDAMPIDSAFRQELVKQLKWMRE